jgi:uncharacterized membrane protein YedE/YeeE
MENFTPVSAAIGGVIIGLSAVLFMALNGRIAGISGIVGGVLMPVRGDLPWRLAFIGGLLGAPLVYWLATSEKPDILFTHPLWLVALGGLLVGFGSRLGGGCTSGHGVCGMARLSKRSIAATGTFMGAAVVTVFLIHLALGL